MKRIILNCTKKTTTLLLALLLLIAGIAGSNIGAASASAAADKPADKIYAATVYPSAPVLTRGGEQTQTVTQTIEYAYKEESEYYNPYSLPGYLSEYSCGITAGGVVLGYYDRLYEDLIPNHTGRTLLGKWVYASQDSAVNSVFDSLYTSMNATAAGVTVSGYKSGLTSYVEDKNRNIAFTSVMNGTNALNKTSYRQAMENGSVLSIFVDGFNWVDRYAGITTNDNTDTVTIYVNVGAHIMVAYGYRDISYYNEEGVCIRQDSYLYVATGSATMSHGLVKLNEYCTTDDCYITTIT